MEGEMDMLRGQRSWNRIRGNGPLRICHRGLVYIRKDGVGLAQME